MSKKKYDKYQPWGSARMNSGLYLIYFNRLCEMAMTRFKWIGLPESCDPRFLEWTLLTQGCATIAHYDKTDQWYSTQAVGGLPNVYDNPSSWRSIGNNGWNFQCNPLNAVFIWDNKQRFPLQSVLDTYSRLLATYDMTALANLNAQKVSWLITAPQEQQATLKSMMQQVIGGEPAIIATKGIEMVETKAISLDVPFQGESINAAKSQVWADALSYLGIDFLPKKTERMIEDEVLASNEPTSLMALGSLDCRREACKKLNERFGLDVQVVWNVDNISDAYNYALNPKIQKAGE